MSNSLAFSNQRVAIVAGTLADVWTNEERGVPMAIFSFAAFAATGLGGPVFGYVYECLSKHKKNRWLTIVAYILGNKSIHFER
jgi:MFS family permease